MISAKALSPSSQAARGIGIRKAILLLLLVAVLPLLAVQTGIYYYWLQTREEREIQTSSELSRSLAASFEAYVHDMGQQESAMAVAINDKGPCPPSDMNEIFKANAADYPALNAFLFVDTQGKIVASSDPRLIGLVIKDREYFQRAVATKDLVLSDLLEGRADPKPIFIVARSVYQGDQLLGVIMGSVEPDRLAEATLKVVGFKEGDASFFDRQGRIVYRYPFREMTWQQRMATESGDVLAKALAGQEAAGVIRFAGERTDRFAIRMPIRKFGWVAGVSTPRDTMLAPLLWSGLLAGGITLLVLAVSLAIALLMIRGMTRGILAVRDRALAVREGVLELTVHNGRIGELRDLAAAFNDMVRAQIEAKEIEARYRTLVEESLVGVYFIQGGKFVYANPRMCDIFGYSQQEVAGRNVLDLVAPQDRPLVAEQMRRRAAGEIEMAHYTFRGLRKDGQTIQVEVIGSRTNYHGRAAIVGSLQDITDRAKFEEELKRTAAELARSNQDLEHFAAIASHDLQEPLRMVSGHLQVAQRRLKDQLDPQTAESIGYAVDGARRMGALIRDLLAFSRVGRQDQGFIDTDMNSVMQQVRRNIEEAIDQAGAKITVEPLPTVKAEPGQMVQLLQNLLGNAIKYRSPDKAPAIQIAATRQEHGWLFCVKDNGIGIDPKDTDRIFMIFQRLHTRQQYPGTGVGLAICKRIVEYHCGRIWVESQEGQGATFYFTIPDRSIGPVANTSK